ncbi:MAG: hypothetical protein JW866_07800, partial [Ignavibacteriales bacterium]|nr:hypothetical protein [Ignavibacteriales bacterium]
MRVRNSFIIILFIPLIQFFAQTNKIQKPEHISSFSYNCTKLNINNISTYIYNDGRLDLAPTFNAGFIFPKGSGKSAIFQTGFLWGLKYGSGFIRVGGTQYATKIIPGIILPNGEPEEQDSIIQRVYRVRRDYKTSDFSSEINDGEGTYSEIYERYHKDWNEWPADRGAPYVDMDKNGAYNPTTDIPGYPGASQTCWFVANDVHPDNMGIFSYRRVNLEIQFITWAYANNEKLKNTIYRSYKLINKSTELYDDMYISIWSDIDIGDATDDLVGCDSNLSLGFAYNSSNKDQQYGISAPSIGILLCQGPIVEGKSTDEAIFNRRVIPGKKNLGMTSFIHQFTAENPFLEYDPMMPYYPPYYFLMQGLHPTLGTPFVNPVTNKSTKYLVSGDPITGNGWVDGVLQNPGDRKIMMTSGPFTMFPGDTQEIIYAITVGHSIDNKNSFKVMKHYSLLNCYDYLNDYIESFPDENIYTPYEYVLYQNYPNPFNPVTKIKFDLPVPNQVSLKIYDILGKEIITLVDDFLEAGIYEIEFNAENLSSGI